LPKIIYLFMAVDWHLYMRRPAVLALAEAARAYGTTVVAVNRPLCPLSTIIKKPSRAGELVGRARLKRLADNLFLYSPRYLIHDRLAGPGSLLETLNLAALRKSLRSLQNRLDIKEPSPIVWFNYPVQGYVSRLWRNSFTVFELYDNLVNINGSPNRSMAEAERRIRDRVDLLLTTSPLLQETYAPPYRNALMYGNGLSRRTFAKLSDSTVRPLPEISEIPSPRLGYAGMISDRMNWSLIGALAELHPQWHFVFAGPVVDEKIRARYDCLENIHFMGSYPQEMMPRVLRSFDVGIMPYRDNDFFKYSNPLKFYELAAAGIGSVASPMDILRQHPDSLVRVVPGDAASWEQAIDAMLSADQAQTARLGREVAARHIWEDMASDLLDKMAGLISRP
jgi:glycosyltransferase involved in cell wall biosynthesis